MNEQNTVQYRVLTDDPGLIIFQVKKGMEWQRASLCYLVTGHLMRLANHMLTSHAFVRGINGESFGVSFLFEGSTSSSAVLIQRKIGAALLEVIEALQMDEQVIEGADDGEQEN